MNPPNVNNVIELQRAELEFQDQIAGAGVQPNYLVADAIEVANIESTDKAEISGPPLASTAANAALQKTVKEAEEEFYLDNSNEYREMVEGGNDAEETPPAPPPPPPSPGPEGPSDDTTETSDSTNGAGGSTGVQSSSGGSTSSGDAVDGVSDLDDDLTNRALEFTEDGYMIENEDGYFEVDAEKLEAWEKYILTRANILAALLMAIGNLFDSKKIAEEVFTGIPIQEDKHSYKEAFARKIRILQKMAQVAVAKLFEKINTENMEIYNDRIKQIKKKYKEWYHKVENFLSGGSLDNKKMKQALEESDKYLRATQNTMNAMQSVISSVIELIKTSFDPSGEMGQLALGMITGLESFSDKIDELNAEVDKGLEEVRANLRKMEQDEPNGFWKNFKKFWKSLVKFDWRGMFKAVKGMNDAVVKALEKTGILWGLAQLLKPISWGANFMAELPRLVLDLMKKIGRLLQKVGDAVIWWACQWSKKSRDWYEKHGRKYTLGYWVGKGLEELSKGIEKGVNKLNELFEKLGKWDYAMGGIGLLPGVGSLYQFVRWADGRIYHFADAAKYLEVDILGIINDYRGGVVGSQNALRGYLAIKLNQSDMRNIAREKFTGLSGIKNDAEMLMQSAESTLGHVTQIFDATASQLMLRTKLHNTTVQLMKNYQQLLRAMPYRLAAAVLTVAAIVISIIIAGITFGAGSAMVPMALLLAVAVAGIGAGLMGAIGTYEASKVESYDPIEAHFTDPVHEKEGAGQTVIDTIDQIDNAEKANMAAAAYNKGLIGQTGDKFYYFNAAEFAAYEMKQKIMDNALRSIFSLIKNSRDLRRVADAEFTGSATPSSGEALLSNAVENVLLQRQMILSAVKFHHQEVVTAKNISKQAEIQAGNAVKMALISIAGAIAGAAIGYAISAVLWATFMGLVSAVASSAFSLYLAVKERNSLKKGFNPSHAELDKLLRSKGGESVEAKLDRAEYEAYLELLADGIVGTGDGYHGLNYDLVTQVYSKLGRIYGAKEALVKARALASELRAIVKQEFSGQVLGTYGDLVKSVNQASFSTAMKVVSNIVSSLQEKVKVMNRARDAEKKMITAAATFAINTAIALTGGIGSAATVGQLTNTTSTGLLIFHKLCVGLTNGLMALTNALASLAQSARTLDKDSLGYYNGYSAKTTVDKTGRQVNDARIVDEKLDQMEYEILLEMNASLMETVDTTFMTVSPEASKLSGRMRALYTVREALALARSILTDAKAQAKAHFSKKSLPRSDFGRGSVEDHKAVALAMLDSLKGALDTIVERKNQIKGAILGVILSAFKVAISLVSIGLGAKAAYLKAGHAYLGDKKTLKFGQGGAKDPDGNFKALDGRSATDINKELSKLSRVINLLNLIDRLLNFTIEVGYNEGMNNHGAKKAETPAAGKNLEQKRSAQKSSDYFSSMDNMDADIDESQVQLSFIDKENMASAYVAARSEQVSDFILTESKSLGDTVMRLSKPPQKGTGPNDYRDVLKYAGNPKNSPYDVAKYIVNQHKGNEKAALGKLSFLKNKDRAMAILKQVELMRPDLKKIVAEVAASLNAPLQKVASPAVVKPSSENNTHTTRTRTQAHLQRAAQIEQSIKAKNEQVARLQKQIVSFKSKASGIKGAIQRLKAQTGKIDPMQLKEQLLRLKVQRDAIRKQLQVRIAEHVRLKAELPAIKARIKAWQAQADIQIKQIRGEKTEIGKQIAVLRGKTKLSAAEQVQLHKLEGQLKFLQTEENMLGAAKVKINDRIKDAEENINRVKSEIDGLRADLKGLQKDIAVLEKEIKKAEVDAKASDARVAETGRSGRGDGFFGFIKSLISTSTERVRKDLKGLENMAKEAMQPKPGETVPSAQMVAGISRTQGRKSYRQQYEEALKQEDTVKSITGAGVC